MEERLSLPKLLNYHLITTLLPLYFHLVSHTILINSFIDLVRSIAITSNAMPASPSEVKLNQISTPPPQSTTSNFNSNGITKNCKSNYKSTFNRIKLKLLSKNIANFNGNHSPPAHNSGKTSSSPSPPNSHVTSRSLSTSNTNDSVSIGSSSVRQISKLKRFLTTLFQFANDISVDVGERVRALIIGLVVNMQNFFN